MNYLSSYVKLYFLKIDFEYEEKFLHQIIYFLLNNNKIIKREKRKKKREKMERWDEREKIIKYNLKKENKVFIFE